MEVRLALVDRRKARGESGLASLAQSAGVSFGRVIAFVDGSDLPAPSVARLNRELARLQWEAA
jgi:hypothetical protein